MFLGKVEELLTIVVEHGLSSGQGDSRPPLATSDVRERVTTSRPSATVLVQEYRV